MDGADETSGAAATYRSLWERDHADDLAELHARAAGLREDLTHAG